MSVSLSVLSEEIAYLSACSSVCLDNFCKMAKLNRNCQKKYIICENVWKMLEKWRYHPLPLLTVTFVSSFSLRDHPVKVLQETCFENFFLYSMNTFFTLKSWNSVLPKSNLYKLQCIRKDIETQFFLCVHYVSKKDEKVR